MAILFRYLGLLLDHSFVNLPNPFTLIAEKFLCLRMLMMYWLPLTLSQNILLFYTIKRDFIQFVVVGFFAWFCMLEDYFSHTHIHTHTLCFPNRYKLRYSNYSQSSYDSNNGFWWSVEEFIKASFVQILFTLKMQITWSDNNGSGDKQICEVWLSLA